MDLAQKAAQMENVQRVELMVAEIGVPTNVEVDRTVNNRCRHSSIPHPFYISN
jgi:hypothetical protein